MNLQSIRQRLSLRTVSERICITVSRFPLALTFMSSFLLGVMKWLILPLLGCYILVLYVYMVTIIAHWELPKALISYLVSAVMIGFVICYVILYPQIKDDVGRSTTGYPFACRRQKYK